MIIPESVLLSSLWPGLAIWVALYISDYSLTLACARLHKRGVDQHIVFEGSFELTPYFQADIDSLRAVSPRFITALVFAGMYLAVIWWTGIPHLYQIVLGALISSQLAVHVRHFRNLFLFRSIIRSGGVQGRIEYARPLMLRGSAVELLAFAGLFGLLSAFLQSWFLLGGAFGCLSTAYKHYRLARKFTLRKATTAALELLAVSNKV